LKDVVFWNMTQLQQLRTVTSQQDNHSNHDAITIYVNILLFIIYIYIYIYILDRDLGAVRLFTSESTELSLITQNQSE
jgi:hypothetical protein